MNQTTKRYLVSSAISFLTGFALAVVPVIDSLTIEGVKDGALLGILFVGVRAGVKALLEGAISYFGK